jgi:hypothetical protein
VTCDIRQMSHMWHATYVTCHTCDMRHKHITTNCLQTDQIELKHEPAFFFYFPCCNLKLLQVQVQSKVKDMSSLYTPQRRNRIIIGRSALATSHRIRLRNRWNTNEQEQQQQQQQQHTNPTSTAMMMTIALLLMIFVSAVFEIPPDSLPRIPLQSTTTPNANRRTEKMIVGVNAFTVDVPTTTTLRPRQTYVSQNLLPFISQRSRTRQSNDLSFLTIANTERMIRNYNNQRWRTSCKMTNQNSDGDQENNQSSSSSTSCNDDKSREKDVPLFYNDFEGVQSDDLFTTLNSIKNIQPEDVEEEEEDDDSDDDDNNNTNSTEPPPIRDDVLGDWRSFRRKLAAQARQPQQPSTDSTTRTAASVNNTRETSFGEDKSSTVTRQQQQQQQQQPSYDTMSNSKQVTKRKTLKTPNEMRVYEQLQNDTLAQEYYNDRWAHEIATVRHMFSTLYVLFLRRCC